MISAKGLTGAQKPDPFQHENISLQQQSQNARKKSLIGETLMGSFFCV